MYQMECYIKCPPDKNVSLAEGAQSINFQVDRPKTNYDWDRFRKLFILFNNYNWCNWLLLIENSK